MAAKSTSESEIANVPIRSNDPEIPERMDLPLRGEPPAAEGEGSAPPIPSPLVPEIICILPLQTLAADDLEAVCPPGQSRQRRLRPGTPRAALLGHHDTTCPAATHQLCQRADGLPQARISDIPTYCSVAEQSESPYSRRPRGQRCAQGRPRNFRHDGGIHAIGDRRHDPRADRISSPAGRRLRRI